MRHLILAIAILMIAPLAYAGPEVVCRSRKSAHAYYGDQGQWTLRFTHGLNDDFITNVSLRNKPHRLLGFDKESKIAKDDNFKPRNERYVDFNRYVTGDAWCSYNLLLPKGLNEIEDYFDGTIYSNCEAGDGGTFAIFCHKLP